MAAVRATAARRRGLTLRTLLFVWFASIVALTAVVFVVFYTTVNGTYRVLSRIQGDQFGIDELARSVDRLYESADNYLHSGRVDYLATYDDEYGACRSQVEALRSRLPDDFRHRLTDIGNMILSFDELKIRTASLYGRGLETIYVNRYIAELARLRGYIRSECSSLLSSYMEMVNTQVASVRAGLDRSSNICTAALLVILLAYIVLALSLNGQVSRPVHTLVESLTRFADGQLDIPPIEASGNREIATLIGSFNGMTVQIRGLVDGMRRAAEMENELRRQEIRTLEMENTLKQSELENLQARINPHFLFNALNTVSALAEIEGAGETKGAVESLGRLLRANLRASRTVVPLGEELESAEHYLRFQKMRFGSRLDYVIRCEEGIRDMVVPGMILQPFVENAVIHGLEPKETGGTVTINACQGDGELTILVADDGMGFDPVRPDLDRLSDAGEEGGRHHLGIQNVSRRLELIYERRVITLESVPGAGTRVTIHLPLPVVPRS
ncbi:MAG TPA: sensor histidine kinase [Spirochaetia bacterium]